jgi:hypothetical protein
MYEIAIPVISVNPHARPHALVMHHSFSIELAKRLVIHLLFPVESSIDFRASFLTRRAIQVPSEAGDAGLCKQCSIVCFL